VGTLKNELVWSSSRERTFRDCRRRYYYSYYGAWEGWESSADPRRRELYALKQLTSRHLWAGSVVHDEIAFMLRRFRGGAAPPDPEEMGQQAVLKMRSQYRISRDASREAFRSDPKGTFRLMEHEYEMNVPRERWVETREKVVRSLRNFFRCDAWDSLQRLDPGDILHVEDPAGRPERLPLWDLEVYAVPDCVFRDEGGAVHVVDWKTGRRDGANWNQLALYALYAQERWGVPAVSVRAREVNLFLATETEHYLDESLLDRLREGIRAGLDEMTGCLVDGDPERNEPLDEETFPLAEDRAVCRMCSFQGVCPAASGGGPAGPPPNF
jgi:hypothetical protein